MAEDVKPLAFGPMQAANSPAPAANNNASEDRIVARILAALGHAPEQTPAPTQENISEEDQRLLNVLGRVFPTGRAAVVKARYQVGTDLYVVEIAYTPSTGIRRDTEALVFDDGNKIFVFGAV